MDRKEISKRYYEKHPTAWKKYRENNRKAVLAREREWYQEHKDQEQARRTETTKRWCRNNPLKALVKNARSRSKKLGIPFDIDVEDLTLPSHCEILGIPIILNSPDKQNSPSLDRIVPALGYVRGNVRVISTRGNILKNGHTLETLELVRSYIARHTTVS
jgi:hypothetical protein